MGRKPFFSTNSHQKQNSAPLLQRLQPRLPLPCLKNTRASFSSPLMAILSMLKLKPSVFPFPSLLFNLFSQSTLPTLNLSTTTVWVTVFLPRADSKILFENTNIYFSRRTIQEESNKVKQEFEAESNPFFIFKVLNFFSSPHRSSCRHLCRYPQGQIHHPRYQPYLERWL